MSWSIRKFKKMLQNEGNTFQIRGKGGYANMYCIYIWIVFCADMNEDEYEDMTIEESMHFNFQEEDITHHEGEL